jgi:hypothetical protein
VTIAESIVANVVNYLVPAAGGTHLVGLKGSPFTSQPYSFDWRQFTVDNFPFMPQGVIIDNTKSANPVTVLILPIGYPITCPAGAILQTPFPAPNGQTLTVESDSAPDDVTVCYFVDYPVLPFLLAAQDVGGAQNVNIVSPTPLPVILGALAQGNVPYKVQESANPASTYQVQISGAALTAAIAPITANQNLRHLIAVFSNDAALAAPGELSVQFDVGGSVFYKETIATPITAPYRINIDFGGLGINCGANNINATISAALSTGVLSVNAFLANQ